MKKFLTENENQTKALGKLLAKEVLGGEIICLSGDLGSGKTTFTQGFLEGIGVTGPYTSPTFNIIKHYRTIQGKETEIQKIAKNQDIYHIDAYRIGEKDILDLGWKDFAGKENCITIIEWAEKIRTLVPNPSAGKVLWIHFKWIDEHKRELVLS